jgi:hypothetical protein
MPKQVYATHSIEINAPIARCFMFFTPAGEELWVDGWTPRYVQPTDGRTEAGMVFTTGLGAESTLWLLADFDPATHHSRYVRCTPGSRMGTVEINCTALDARRTVVEVSYTMTALSPAGETALQAFEGEHFAQMIDGWAEAIAAKLPLLLAAQIR